MVIFQVFFLERGGSGGADTIEEPVESIVLGRENQ